MGKADLHMHSSVSDGIASVQEILDYAEYQTDLDVIAITDHDTLAGAWQAQEYVAARRYRVQVIVGMEITTQIGHLLAYDLSRPIPKDQSLETTLAQVHEQGGFCIVPHPMSRIVRGIPARELQRVLTELDRTLWFHGLEVINPTVAGRLVYRKVRRLAQAYPTLAQTAGSDAHTLELIGSAYTTFPGRSVADLRVALQQAQTAPAGHFWGWREHRLLLQAAGPWPLLRWVWAPVCRLCRSLGQTPRSGWKRVLAGRRSS